VSTVRLTAAQALVRFLAVQYVERDEARHRFFGGCFGIFGHGNVGIAEALLEHSELVPYHQGRNEQGNSIGALFRSVGLDGFGTQYRFAPSGSPVLDSDDEPPSHLPLDLAANAASLGAVAIRAGTLDELRSALERAKSEEVTTVIVIEVDRYVGVPGYDSWWNVPVAEVSELAAVKGVRAEYETARLEERRFL
jgi:TPP-dependent trihydroxycyclohexane-1,2-dione (THcHDO) dehydratase